MRFLVASNLLIYPEHPWLAYNLIMLVFSFTVTTYFVIAGTVSLYYARNDILAFVEIAHSYSLVVGLWVVITNHYLFTMPVLHKLFQVVDEDVFVYKTVYGREEDEKLKTKMKTYENIFQNILHFALLTAGVLLAVIAPILIHIFGSEDRKRIKEINYDMPVPMWSPFNTDNAWGFTVAYAFLVCEIMIVVMYIGCAVPTLVYVVFEVNLQYIILERSILNLESRANEIYKLENADRYGTRNPEIYNFEKFKNENLHSEMVKNDPLYERCVRECLRENILHHIAIIRFFKLYQDLTSTIYGVIIALSMMVLASLTLVLTRTKLFSFETVKFTFLFVLELTMVFGYCLMGTSLSEASKKVPNALYNCPWFNLSANQKKTILIFQICTKDSIALKGSGLFGINLQLFVQIVRTTYSIFNIFSSMDH